MKYCNLRGKGSVHFSLLVIVALLFIVKQYNNIKVSVLPTVSEFLGFQHLLHGHYNALSCGVLFYGVI